jgi:hypothetical protein
MTMSASRNMTAMRLISRNFSQRAAPRTRICAPANLATRNNDFFMPSTATRFEHGISSRFAPVGVRHMSSSSQPEVFVKDEIESNKVRAKLYTRRCVLNILP